MDNFQVYFNEHILSIKVVSGGSIGSSFYIKTTKNEYFLKKYRVKGISEAEAAGLKELSKVDVSNIKVYYYDNNYIIMNFIHQGVKNADYNIRAGQLLAKLHSFKGDSYGYTSNNFIGSTMQINTISNSWSSFFIERRLNFQIELSKRNGFNLKELYNKAIPQIDSTLNSSIEDPTLIHGDLWSGNIIPDSYGNPVLVDPAVYYGHRECDIAMTKLFGGFTEDFYQEYNSLYPLKKGWENRIDLYNLYHILNHLNLFGSSYLSQAESILNYYAFGA